MLPSSTGLGVLVCTRLRTPRCPVQVGHGSESGKKEDMPPFENKLAHISSAGRSTEESCRRPFGVDEVRLQKCLTTCNSWRARRFRSSSLTDWATDSEVHRRQSMTAADRINRRADLPDQCPPKVGLQKFRSSWRGWDRHRLDLGTSAA